MVTMEVTRLRNRFVPNGAALRVFKSLRLADYKTDIFLSANVMDAVITYVALQQGTQLTEFNSILYGVMNTIGIGTTLFMKVVLCVLILWVLRKTKKEKLLIPLAAFLFVVALTNLIVARLHGIDL